MQANNKQTTIKDVAVSAGMSVSTASAILNGRTGFSAATCKKVWDAAHELDYRPNARARMLRRGEPLNAHPQTHILMHISHQGGQSLCNDPLEAHRALLLDEGAQAQGYFLTHYWYHQIQGFQCPLILDRLVDGVLLGCPHAEIIETLRDKIPTVLMDVNLPPEQTGLSVVNMDLPSGWRSLLSRVAACGRHGIFVVRTPDYTRMFERGLDEAMEATGQRPQTAHDIYIPLTQATHYPRLWEVAERIANAVRKRLVSVLIAPNLSAATTLHDMLANLDVRFPEELSMLTVNYQTSPNSLFACINYDWTVLARTALSTLLARLDNRHAPVREHLVAASVTCGMMLPAKKA
ncbi:MAG: LacI family DNA-binding transcriptional regulator [Victivallales bacterium]|nr:LacI family DNA-binding transcriptional regulator [Victivallales bacterium]